ncbi:hypothetical protein F511_19514 [Dorcoceras hygrometricum]|uniref:Protein kinase domain-containing protein n=1 Tax=Dorcoceras hygrometricum TaxID=472368 RepID=A0A2Z7C5I9_9LAMI|nr:hypothetical protein F511_19514 [Dorcoceras hygrometricum]
MMSSTHSCNRIWSICSWKWIRWHGEIASICFQHMHHTFHRWPITWMPLNAPQSNNRISVRADDCTLSRCSFDGPEVRFPFRLKSRQPQHCGYNPGFDLNETLLALPFSDNFRVVGIYYGLQEISLHSTMSCYPQLNLSASSFRMSPGYDLKSYTMFNCSATHLPYDSGQNCLSWLSTSTYTIYALSSYYTYDPFSFVLKPNNILLDHNFNPKICNFGLAKLCSKEQSAVTITAARGTMGYIAPEVLSRAFGRVSNKSDVYCFGMLLLEMVGGRKNVDRSVDTSQVHFSQLTCNRLSRQEISVSIEEEDDDESKNIVRKLTIVGLWCIHWNPSDRPSMKRMVQMLEVDGSNLTMPPDPFPLQMLQILLQECVEDIIT